MLFAPAWTFIAAIALHAPAFDRQEADFPKPRPAVVKGAQGKSLDALVRNYEAFGFSGSVYVSKKGKPILLQGYGVADSVRGTACTPETLFDIASASKQVTATAILLLESEGKLELSDSISKHLPGVPEHSKKVTIDHLLTHTSGYPRSAAGGGGHQLEAAVRGYLNAQPVRRPGAGYEYWNGGYALLAAIVEQVSGQQFEYYVRDELFGPAGLKNSDFIETERVSSSNLARSHENGAKLTTDYIKGWGYRGMGGVLTSAADLGLWVDQVPFGKKVLKKKSRALLLRPELQGYARGWRVTSSPLGNQVIEHGGSSPGFNTEMKHFPNDGYTIIVIANVEGIARELAMGLEATLYKSKAIALPPEVVAWKGGAQQEWLGLWRNEAGLEVELVANGSSLEVARASRELRGLLSGQESGGSFDWECERAREVILALGKGDPSVLQQVLASHVPASWPQRIVEMILPPHLEARGAIQSVQAVAAARASNDVVTVWLEVQHEKGMWPVEIQFRHRKLGILDWETKSAPKAIRFAHVGKGLCLHYNFKREENRPRLELDAKKSGSKELVLRFQGQELRMSPLARTAVTGSDSQ